MRDELQSVNSGTRTRPLDAWLGSFAANGTYLDLFHIDQFWALRVGRAHSKEID